MGNEHILLRLLSTNLSVPYLIGTTEKPEKEQEGGFEPPSLTIGCNSSLDVYPPTYAALQFTLNQPSCSIQPINASTHSTHSHHSSDTNALFSYLSIHPFIYSLCTVTHPCTGHPGHSHIQYIHVPFHKPFDHPVVSIQATHLLIQLSTQSQFIFPYTYPHIVNTLPTPPVR